MEARKEGLRIDRDGEFLCRGPAGRQKTNDDDESKVNILSEALSRLKQIDCSYCNATMFAGIMRRFCGQWCFKKEENGIVF